MGSLFQLAASASARQGGGLDALGQSGGADNASHANPFAVSAGWVLLSRDWLENSSICLLFACRMLALSPPSLLPPRRAKCAPIRKTKQAPAYTCTCYRLDTRLLLTRESHRSTGLRSGSLFGFGAPAGGGRSEEDKDGIAQELGHGKGGGSGGRRVLKVKGKKADSLGGETTAKEGE